MCLGALLDAGLTVDQLDAELRKLSLKEYRLTINPVLRGVIGATLAEVAIARPAHSHRHLPEIKNLINHSRLSDSVKNKSLSVFDRLAAAEAAIHRCAPDEVHFHEVGAVDAIIDIVGTVAGLELLGINKVICSSLPMGSGFVDCAHGRLPLPAPAVVELLKGCPVYPAQITGETVTPTGAALAVTLAAEFGAWPALTISRVGYGAGTADRPIPNVLRLIIGEESGLTPLETVNILETTIDDMNPEWYLPVISHLFSRGALDVFLTPIYMKKTRPGTMLTVLCRPESVAEFCHILLTETTTLGVRIREERRLPAERQLTAVDTPYGEIHIKVRPGSPGGLDYFAPEYEDCRRAAEIHEVPIWVVYEAARESFSRKIIKIQ